MTTEPMTTGQTFGERHFGRAQLGDQRRTRRLVALADQLASHPGGTLPHKVKSPKDLKALYRLCECPAVTHEAVLATALYLLGIDPESTFPDATGRPFPITGTGMLRRELLG